MFEVGPVSLAAGTRCACGFSLFPNFAYPITYFFWKYFFNQFTVYGQQKEQLILLDQVDTKIGGPFTFPKQTKD